MAALDDGYMGGMSATVQEVAVLRHHLLAKGQELASMLSDLMSGKNPARSTRWTPSRARPRRRRLRRYLVLIPGQD